MNTIYIMIMLAMLLLMGCVARHEKPTHQVPGDKGDATASALGGNLTAKDVLLRSFRAIVDQIPFAQSIRLNFNNENGENYVLVVSSSVSDRQAATWIVKVTFAMSTGTSKVDVDGVLPGQGLSGTNYGAAIYAALSTAPEKITSPYILEITCRIEQEKFKVVLDRIPKTPGGTILVYVGRDGNVIEVLRGR